MYVQIEYIHQGNKILYNETSNKTSTYKSWHFKCDEIFIGYIRFGPAPAGGGG